jgi:hypothetical protein
MSPSVCLSPSVCPLRSSDRAADPRIHQAAQAITQDCLWLIRGCLREEEWPDALAEFYRIARERIAAMRPASFDSGRRR